MMSQWLRILTARGVGLAIVGGPGRTAMAADPDPCKPSGASVTDAYKLGDPTKKEYVAELGNKVAVVLDKPTEFHTEAATRFVFGSNASGWRPAVRVFLSGVLARLCKGNTVENPISSG